MFLAEDEWDEAYNDLVYGMPEEDEDDDVTSSYFDVFPFSELP